MQWSVHLNLPKSPTNSPAFIINRVRDSTWCLSVCPSNDSLESSEISNSRKGLLHNWIQLQILHWTSTYLEYLFPNISFPKPQQMQGRLIRHNKWPYTVHYIYFCQLGEPLFANRLVWSLRALSIISKSVTLILEWLMNCRLTWLARVAIRN